MDRTEIEYNGEEPLDNLKQEKFCIEYVRSYGMRVDSYCIAYGLDRDNPVHYKGASASASRLLENVKVKAYLEQRQKECQEQDDVSRKWIADHYKVIIQEGMTLKYKRDALTALKYLSEMYGLEAPKKTENINKNENRVIEVRKPKSND